MTTLKEFYKLLESHDWYYTMSDDSFYYKKGQAEWDNLVKIAKESPEHEKLGSAYVDYMSGKSDKPIIKE